MSPLSLALRANALSCLGFGTLFLIAPYPTARFLGHPPVWLIIALGSGLVVNGLHLWAASGRQPIRRWEIIWFSLGDFLWWLGSLTLVSLGIWITGPAAVAATLSVALIVAALGVTQLFLLGMARSGLTAKQHWRRLGQSWMGLPPAVKAWLLVLNAVFLASAAFWPAAIARYTLAAYVATGPLLLGMAAAQAGLTRLLGIAHLVAWIPLVVWLLPEASLETSQGLYGLGLLVVTLICLAFDLWDVLRWCRGERAALGLPLPPQDDARSVDEGPPLR